MFESEIFGSLIDICHKNYFLSEGGCCLVTLCQWLNSRMEKGHYSPELLKTWLVVTVNDIYLPFEIKFLHFRIVQNILWQ
jgi:hypothetical protein